MQKTFIKILIYFAIFLAVFFAYPTTNKILASAGEACECECLEALGEFATGTGPGTCSDFCSRETAEGHPLTMKSCEDPDGDGYCNCLCHYVAGRVDRSEDCETGCGSHSYSCPPITEVGPIEEGEPCPGGDADCSGTGGACGADRCFCDSATSRCNFQLTMEESKTRAQGDPGKIGCKANNWCQTGQCHAIILGGDCLKVCVGTWRTGTAECTLPTEAPTTPTIPTGPTPLEDINKIKRIPFETVPALVNYYIKGLLPFVGIWALIFFVFGGILWLTSGGSPDKIKKAQQMMFWAAVGIVVIFASYAIVSRIIPAVGG